MGYVERYLRNRMKLQIVTNYVGVIGALFFSLQNLSTNWGGSYQDDSALEDAVKAHPLAGTAWDEAFMQVGALQMAWLFFVLGAELQGNVEAGRYKRIMTWMINLPVVVFMIGNMILAARRNGDGVETSSGMAVNMVVGAVFIVLSIACTVIYAADDDYKNEKWLVLVSQVQPLSRHAQPTGPRSFHNNRFMPQFILHLAAMGCLMYFAIIGLHHYDLDQGWLLTDAYKSDAEAVNAWDKASASVGMGAVPLMFMLFGFELQGDLAPYNFKPLAVFVGCLNIFISSIFLYATTWDAYDTSVIRSHIAPLIIMICLCIWAIICIWLYAFVEPFTFATWLKPLADGDAPLVPMKQQPMRSYREGPAKVAPPQEFVPLVRQQERGYRHVGVSWGAVPSARSSDVEYRLSIEKPGAGMVRTTETQVVDGVHTSYLIDRFQGQPLQPGDRFNVGAEYRLKSEAGSRSKNGGWQPAEPAAPTPVATLPYDPDSKLHVRQRDAGSSHVTAEWGAAPGTRTNDIQYRVTVTKPGSDWTEEVVVPGSQRTFKLETFNGRPVTPEDDFYGDVAFRHMRDSHEPEGGWQGSSGPVPLEPRSDRLPAGWKCTPRQTDCGTRHVSAAWKAPPNTDLTDVEYRVELEGSRGNRGTIIQDGEEPRIRVSQVRNSPIQPNDRVLCTVAYRHKGDAHEHDEGWQRKGEQVALRAAPEPPQGWKVVPRSKNATTQSVDVEWEPAPGVSPDDAQYLVSVRDADGGAGLDTYELPGDTPKLRLTKYDGQRLAPSQKVAVEVQYRHKGDAGYPEGGWGRTGITAAATERRHLGEIALAPRIAEGDGRVINVDWDAAPDMAPADVEYRVLVTDDATGKTEEHVVAGDKTNTTIETFRRGPLGAGRPYTVDVQVRDKGDAGNAGGGWKPSSAPPGLRMSKPEPPADWVPQPTAQGATPESVTVGWKPAPGVPAEQAEYQVVVRKAGTTAADAYTVPGGQTALTLNSFDGRPLQPQERLATEVSYRHVTDPLADEDWSHRGQAIVATERRHMGDARIAPRVEEGDNRTLRASWEPVPDVAPEDVEYRVTVRDPVSGKTEERTLTGDRTSMLIDSFDGQPLRPGQPLQVDVQAKDRADTEWKPSTGAVPITLRKPTPPADWMVRPRGSNATTDSVVVSWRNAPGVPPEDTQYKVSVSKAGSEHKDEYVTENGASNAKLETFAGRPLQPNEEVHVDVDYRHVADAAKADGGWGYRGSTEVATDRVHLGDFHVTTRAREADDCTIAANWDAPVGVAPEDVEYRITVTDPATGETEEMLVPGNKHVASIDSLNGTRLKPGQTLQMDVQCRDRGDAAAAGGGWKPSTSPVLVRMAKLEPPADYVTQPVATELGPHHIEAGWAKAPNMPESDVEYRVTVKDASGASSVQTVPGTQNQLFIDQVDGRPLQPGDAVNVEVEYRDKTNASQPNGGWGRSAGPTRMTTKGDGLPADWHIQSALQEAGTRHATVAWAAPPGVPASDLEYRVTTVTSDGRREQKVVPGSQTSMRIDQCLGAPLADGSAVVCEVEYRHPGDASEASGGWQRTSGPQEFRCAAPVPAEWACAPEVRSRDEHSVTVNWAAPPATRPENVEYYVAVADDNGENKEDLVVQDPQLVIKQHHGEPLRPGQELNVNVAVRRKTDTRYPDGGWQGASGYTPVQTKKAKARRPKDWRVTARVEEEALADIIVDWDDVPLTRPSEVEYRVLVTEHGKDEDGDGKDDMEEYICPGEQTAFMIDEFKGEPLIPGESFSVNIAWRHKADSDKAGGGWQGYSGPTDVHTLKMTRPVELLKSRIPRIFLLQEIGFKSNSDHITAGMDSLPEVHRLLQEYPDMEVNVEGHVNFGQKDRKAKELSKARATKVVRKLIELGTSQGRLFPSGFGWTRPRFPRGSAHAKKNRRVEFRVKPGSELYERLAAEAAARRARILAEL